MNEGQRSMAGTALHAIDLFSALEQVLSPEAYRVEALRRLSIASAVFRGCLSHRAATALEVATNYWNGANASVEEVERARVEVWRELDQIAATEGTHSRRCIALRGVVCLMYPTIEPAEVLDLVETSLGLMQRLGFADSEIEAALQSACGGVAPGARGARH